MCGIDVAHGINRMDNGLGYYHPHNLESFCYSCNMSLGASDQLQYRIQMMRIYKHKGYNRLNENEKEGIVRKGDEFMSCVSSAGIGARRPFKCTYTKSATNDTVELLFPSVHTAAMLRISTEELSDFVNVSHQEYNEWARKDANLLSIRSALGITTELMYDSMDVILCKLLLHLIHYYSMISNLTQHV